MQYQTQINDQRLSFVNGVAAIDLMTLDSVSKVIEFYIEGGVVTLPAIAEGIQTLFFEELLQVGFNPKTLKATAKIDTQKMTWNESARAEKSTLTDYRGLPRLGVSFSWLEVANVDGVPVTVAPLELHDGRTAHMWFAEMPIDVLQNSYYFQLFETVNRLTSNFKTSSPERYDQVIVPAQDIDYERKMVEIEEMNILLLEEVLQKFKIGLDDTGARVQVEITMVARSSTLQPKPEPKVAIFGSNNPVVFWLTEVGENVTPFAVVATTSEAWLDPSQTVKFDF